MKRNLPFAGTTIKTVAGILAASALLLWAAQLGWFPFLAKWGDEAHAAWAQAIMSVVAIIAGFVGIGVQARTQAQQEIDRENGVLKSVWLLVYQSRVNLEYCLEPGHRDLTEHMSELDRHARALRKLPPLDIPDPFAISAVIQVVDQYGPLKKVIAEFAHPSDRHPQERGSSPWTRLSDTSAARMLCAFDAMRSLAAMLVLRRLARHLRAGLRACRRFPTLIVAIG